ncbi:very short patch repair endonuclease [Nocardia sp. CY41]|uniref:very short patch repair endonuclease n=1 Tax=Nocardia sp. CY41 TaxID=2608686 RepID=UPI00135B5830|nr:very short patch repair endonuclease [Nocardia sp. CY41]
MVESWASSAAVRASMQSNRSRDTKPEMLVRRAVHAMGLRYRVAARPLLDQRFTADLVFTRARVAVFIDGCYWHGCPLHHRLPRQNQDYWLKKIERNQDRDMRTDSMLKSAGWRSLRFWEHEDPSLVAATIAKTIGERTSR